MSKLEKTKTTIKNIIPWQLRYQIKLYEASHGFYLPMKSKQDIEHYNDVLYEILDRLGGIDCVDGKTVCEIGPGEYLTHAALLYQLGVAGSYLLDIEDLASSPTKVVVSAEVGLKDNGWRKQRLPKFDNNEKWNTYLRKINCSYNINGLDGYKEIENNSVDFIFSDAVFEHIRKNIFVDTIKEMYRFSKMGGVSYHIVDLRDHMGGGKNHLRFKEAEWEDEIHYRMDNYTNRLTCAEICKICEDVGFREIVVNRSFYNSMPLKRNDLTDSFKQMDEEEIMTKSFTIRMVK